MRGTCSPGFVLRATIRPEQVLPAPFSTVMAESIVPVTHILWSHLWLASPPTRSTVRGRSCGLGQGQAARRLRRRCAYPT